jgi:Sulfotransferase domain
MQMSERMSIKVIGAGFGRTGTDSLREALGMLGFGPCHHMLEVIGNEDQTRMWRAVAQGATPDWNQLFAGYASCVDWPSAHYWRALIEFYPEAKVVLTYRSAESWWKSFEQTILTGLRMSTDPKSLGLALIRDQVFGGRADDREHAIAVYEENVRAVKATVPPERLLVHNLGDGWSPLCAHLGVSVPPEAYPSRNNASDFQDKLLKQISPKS